MRWHSLNRVSRRTAGPGEAALLGQQQRWRSEAVLGSKQQAAVSGPAEQLREENRAPWDQMPALRPALKPPRPAASTVAGSLLLDPHEQKGTHRDRLAAERPDRRHPARRHPAWQRRARRRAGRPLGSGPESAAPAPVSRSSCRSHGPRWSHASTAGQGNGFVKVAAGLLEPLSALGQP